MVAFRSPILGICLLLTIAVAANSSETSSLVMQKRTPTIAVLPFSDNNQSASQQSYGQVVAAMFGTHLRNETNFIVVEKGSSTKTEVTLTGSVSVVGGLIQIDTRLISTATGDVTVAEYAQIPQNGDLRTTVSKLSKSIEDKYLRQWMGDLQVSVFPVEGEVYLNDQFMGKSNLANPLRLNNLLEGKYALRVLAGGYENYEQAVLVNSRTLREIQVSLQSLPGSLKIESEPNGADVFVNEQKIGETPLSLDSITPGDYAITMQKNDFKMHSQIAKVQSGQLLEIKAILEVVSGQTFIQSSPTNALVFIHQKFMGTTPLLLENVTPGILPISLKMQGYSDYNGDIKILPGKKNEVNAELKRQTGKFTLVSAQRDLSVKIEGEKELSLNAPFHKQELNAGKYRITISKPQYYDKIDSIEIKPNEELRLETELILKPGKLSFAKAQGVPVDIYIDGTYKGKSNGVVLEIPEGTHDILLKNWFGEKQFSAQIKADETKNISVDEFVRNSAFSWWGVVGAVLVAMPIYFVGHK